MLFHEATQANAEMALLNCVVLDPGKWADVSSLIPSADYFSDLGNREIYTEMAAVAREHGSPEPVIVFQRLLESGKTDCSRFIAITNSCPTSLNFGIYAKEVMLGHTRSRLAHEAGVLSEDVKRKKPGLEWIQERASRIVEMAASRVESEKIEGTDDLAAESILRLEALLEGGGIVGLRTGFADYDKLTRGLTPDMHVIAARPSVGKTAMALNIARNVAVKEGKKVLFVSMEMSKQQLMDRLIMLEGGINERKLRGGFLGRAEKAKIRPAASAIGMAPIELVKKPSMTPAVIKSAISQHPDAALVIIDYLQLMETDDRFGSRQEAVSTISRSIKIMSGQFNVPIIALSQLNRESDGEMPKLKHLRESGSIEQDADTVLFLHPQKDSGNLVASLSKGRNCGTGIFTVHFDRDTQRMRDFGTAPEQAPPSREVEQDYEEDDDAF